jgi:hypothetical protein
MAWSAGLRQERRDGRRGHQMARQAGVKPQL